MAIDPEKLSETQLENLIQNHRKRNAVEAPLYLNALAELEQRKGKGLSFQKSFWIIKQAAAEGKFLSYKDLADASNADWGQVHYAIGGHLWNLIEYAHRRGWPMLSAIVVNKANVLTGDMEPPTLDGFVKAARELGYAVLHERAFLKEQQKRVFEWGKGEPTPTDQ